MLSSQIGDCDWDSLGMGDLRLTKTIQTSFSFEFSCNTHSAIQNH